jgi:Arc/MetJ-type ribon-helix-helix transcriptional regulator
MRVSASLPAEDVEYLDNYARERQLGSRSAALHAAVRMLRAAELSAEYERVWVELDKADEDEAWDTTSGDGLMR